MRTRQKVRCLAGGLAAALSATGAAMLAGGSPAHATPAPGQGSASAQALAVAPHDGSLAVGVVLGEALAGHTNGQAKAQSQGIDLGAIGTAMTGYNCGSQALQPDQIPQPLITETGAPGADQGIHQGLDPSKGASQPSYGSDEFVRATSTPYGEADTSFAPVNVQGITVSGMATRAWSGLKDGERQAGATADIASLDLGNGLVKLGGLHWESVYPSGGQAAPSGSFTIGSLEIAGHAVPLNQNVTALQTAINTALGAVGLQVLLPQPTLSNGVESVSPLQLQAVPNTTRDSVVNLGLNATESQQQQVLGGLENGFPGEPAQLAQALCQSDTPITVAQVAIASVNGGGYLSAGLGGVTATSSDVAANPYDLSLLGPLTLSNGNGPLGGGSAPVAATSPTAGLVGAAPAPTLATSPAGPGAPTPATAAPAPSPAPAPAAAVTSPAAAGYAAGGPLLGIGLAGLALLGLLAEADRRMMRRAQHTITFEEGR